MDPITSSVAVTAAVLSVTAPTDVSGAIDIISSISDAISSGNYQWAAAAIVYSLLELSKGRVPGTKLQIPKIPAILSEHVPAGAIQGLSAGLSALVAGLFILAGQPAGEFFSSFAIGWLGSMGLNGADDSLNRAIKLLKTSKD